MYITEHEYIRMEEAMLDGLLPVVDAAQGIAWTSFGMLIGVVLSVLALHLIGVLTSHAIKTRHLFPVRSAYVIYGGSVRGLRCFAPKERYDSPEPPVSPSRMDRTLETDDTDCCTAPSSPASTLPGYKAASNVSYPKTLQMPCSLSTSSGQLRKGHSSMTSSKSLCDVGFSETKV